MNKINLGYYTLKEVAERWGCTEYEILEWGANGLLKIHLASALRGSRTPLITPDPSVVSYLKRKLPDSPDKDRSPRPIHAHILNDMLDKRGKYFGSRFVTLKDLAITEKESHRFEQEQGLQILTENDYPPELRIAVEVWREVFSQGLTPQSPLQSKYEMVDDALELYNLGEETQAGRIKRVIVDGSPTKKIEEPTTTKHSKNEHGHPHHAPLLEIAVMLWQNREKINKDTFVANEGKDIFTLLNTKPKGGRRTKVD